MCVCVQDGAFIFFFVLQKIAWMYTVEDDGATVMDGLVDSNVKQISSCLSQWRQLAHKKWTWNEKQKLANRNHNMHTFYAQIHVNRVWCASRDKILGDCLVQFQCIEERKMCRRYRHHSFIQVNATAFMYADTFDFCLSAVSASESWKQNKTLPSLAPAPFKLLQIIGYYVKSNIKQKQHVLQLPCIRPPHCRF